MDAEELVEVYSVNDPTKAELVANLLRDHGIACSLDGEHQAGFTGIFKVGILVKAEDADHAARVIETHHAD